MESFFTASWGYLEQAFTYIKLHPFLLIFITWLLTKLSDDAWPSIKRITKNVLLTLLLPFKWFSLRLYLYIVKRMDEKDDFTERKKIRLASDPYFRQTYALTMHWYLGIAIISLVLTGICLMTAWVYMDGTKEHEYTIMAGFFFVSFFFSVGHAKTILHEVEDATDGVWEKRWDILP